MVLRFAIRDENGRDETVTLGGDGQYETGRIRIII
jgi:hypothetical protein